MQRKCQSSSAAAPQHTFHSLCARLQPVGIAVHKARHQCISILQHDKQQSTYGNLYTLIDHLMTLVLNVNQPDSQEENKRHYSSTRQSLGLRYLHIYRARNRLGVSPGVCNFLINVQLLRDVIKHTHVHAQHIRSLRGELWLAQRAWRRQPDRKPFHLCTTRLYCT